MYIKENKKDKISQGDIFQKFHYVRWAELVEGGILEEDFIEIPYFVVLTQSCDLEWDFKDRYKRSSEKRDKFIQSILVCPAYVAESFKGGQHLESQSLVMQDYHGKTWPLIKDNNNSRYHFLKKNEELGIPDLVIDFKQYYTIPTHILYKFYKQHYVGSLMPLFREALSHRFAFYLSRIGLPDIKSQNSDEIKQESNQSQNNPPMKNEQFS